MNSPRNLAFAAFMASVIVIGCGGGGGGGSTTVTGGTTSGGPGTNTRLNGTVVIDGTTTGVSGVRIVFYNAAGNPVGSVTSNSSGVYTYDVSPSATTFFVDGTTVNRTTFYGSFYYLGDSFQYSLSSCKAGLPALTSGATISLQEIGLPAQGSPPPPPPTNCR